MNVVFLHCHLLRGGVTGVIHTQGRALADAAAVDRVILASGPRIDASDSTPHLAGDPVVIADLQYDDDGVRSDPSKLDAHAEQIAAELSQRLDAIGVDRDQTVLHWHNPTLGRNAAIPIVIRKLTDRGWRQLLQIHDFAEDNRTENWRHLAEAFNVGTVEAMVAELYPRGPTLRYATLTHGDARLLTAAGIASTQIDVLPNSVNPAGRPNERKEAGPPDRDAALPKVRTAFDLPGDARWTLYPVRGIRRKNLGEWILLTRWMPDDVISGVTLRPRSEVEAHSYDRWRHVASEFAPRARFDVGEHVEISLADNLAACDYVISTSVAEGFGMSYLEPWLSGRGVVARRLPIVTDDLCDLGLTLDRFYDAIFIPGSPDWITACDREYNQLRDHAWSHVPPALRPIGAETRPAKDTIDFARLHPRRQVEVIERAATDRGFDDAIRSRNATLIADLSRPWDQRLLEQNAEAIEMNLNPAVGASHLTQIYRNLLAIDTTKPTATRDEHRKPRGVSATGGTRIIDAIDRARPFFPCRTETF